jgi:PKD repeat protein
MQAVALDASSSASSDGSALQYVWEFDGAQRGGGVKIAHVFATAGDRTVKLTVIDATGQTSSVTRTITVAAATVTSTPVTAQVLVQAVDGTPLPGVTVNPATGSTLSDSAGKMTITVNAGAATSLEFSKTGYSDQFLSIDVPAGSGTDGYIQLTMRVRDAALTLTDAAAGGTLTGRDGATIALPANAFVDASGAPVTGAVQIAVTPIDVTQPGAGGFPGSFEGIEIDGTQTPIVSAGVDEFVPTANGAAIQLAPGKTATISIPIYAALRLDGTLIAVGDSIPLWSLDEATGIWIQEGTGTVAASADSPSGLALQAVASHLSWWNADLGFDPYGPQPQCVAEGYTGIPGSTNYLAAASICNMLAAIDRGSGGDNGGAIVHGAKIQDLARRSGTPSAAAALTPQAMAFSHEYAVPIAGGQSIAVPANVDVRLTAFALNGTWTGSKVVHGATLATDPVTVSLHPVSPVSTTPEPISLPFDDTRSVAAPATAQFSFTAPAQSVARVTLSQGPHSTFNGTLRLLQGTTVIGTASVVQFELEQVVAYLPAAGTYTIEADIDRAATFHLQAALEASDAQVQPITLPFNAERSLLPQPSATYGFTGTAAQFVRIVVSTPTNGSGGNTTLSGQVRLLQGTTVLASATLSGTSTQLLVNLTASGPYTIEITGAAGSSFQLAADLEGSVQSETLTVPTDITRSMAAGSVYRGTLTLSAVTTLYFDSRHVSGEPSDVKLLAADASILFEAPPVTSESDATNSFVATLQPGTYTILVAPKTANAATERLTLSTTSWVPVAPTLPAKSSSTGQTIDLVMDRNGKPVVGLVKITSINSHNAHILQLRRWSGTQWDVVGADIEIDNPCELTDGASFAFDNANNPVVIYASTAADNSTTFSAHRWSGSAWVAVGANGGQLPAGASTPTVCARPTSMLVGADNQPVVAYMTDTGPILEHFNGTSWSGYVTPAGDSFGDAGSNFEARFDPAGKLWMVYSAGLSIPSGNAKRLNLTTHSWDAIGSFAQVNTSGLQVPRLRFDSAGSPVVAWLAAVGTSGTQGVVVYRFDGTTWNTAGGHVADSTLIGPNPPNPAFVLFNDQAVLAWDNEQENQVATVVVQTNSNSGWTAVDGGVGQIPQYSRTGVSAAIAQNAHLATDGTDIYLSVIALPDGGSQGLDAALTLLKKVGP